jgi:hypothetical protein
VPFDYFFDENEAWNLVKPKLKNVLTVDNFWVLYLLIEIIYDKNTEIVEMLISKVV